MNVGLHGLSRLPGHGLKAVQQDVVGEGLQGSSHNHAAYDHQNQDIKSGISQYPPIQAPFYLPAGTGVRLLSCHVPVAPFLDSFLSMDRIKAVQSTNPELGIQPSWWVISFAINITQIAYYGKNFFWRRYERFSATYY
jgi:hypothetical protein